MKYVMATLLLVTSIPLFGMCNAPTLLSRQCQLIAAISDYDGHENIDFATNADENIRTIYDLVVNKSLDLNYYINNYITPLRAAFWGRKLSLITFLLDHKANINYIGKSKYGFPLGIVVDQAIRLPQEQEREQATTILHYLLARGIDVNYECRDNEEPFTLYTTITPLSLNFNSDRAYEIAKILINNNANVNLHDEAGNTALMKLYCNMAEWLWNGRVEEILMTSDTSGLATIVKNFTLLFVNVGNYTGIPLPIQKKLLAGHAPCTSYLGLLPADLQKYFAKGTGLDLSKKNKNGQTMVSLARHLTPLFHQLHPQLYDAQWHIIVSNIHHLLKEKSTTY